ncbi:hypothetical protein [Paenibacillus nasutitermitis]|uniref:Uncharacterized protein n=1 Tax=Paenibacillus nasutitermitis TaxID=1652958 RepID=A0A916YP32_9BACL|nr:hypothetical protein [Paenibacillus nasutitermitis]GGD54031.1 hypothetical protein GCM10010911_09440 [Paenibacillus nasutitermitis]
MSGFSHPFLNMIVGQGLNIGLSIYMNQAIFVDRKADKPSVDSFTELLMASNANLEEWEEIDY